MSSKKDENSWQNYAVKIALNTASHPIEYAKVLIQIGFEPLPPQQGSTFFGQPALKLPNIFQYIKYIKQEDGIVGCYRGMFPRLCGNVLSALVSYRFLNKREDENDQEAGENAHRAESDQHNHEVFVRNIQKEVLMRFTTIVISHPFHVVTVRMMAQFVGRETQYEGVLSSIIQIYQECGIMGFFNGIIPRIIGDILSILIANTLTYALSTYVISDPELHVYSSASMSFFASALTYPFQVVSNCMAINNSELTAGCPPYMPIYTSWLDCWSNLSNQNQLKRGSSLLVRYYTGPQKIIGGKLVPVLESQ